MLNRAKSCPCEGEGEQETRLNDGLFRVFRGIKKGDYGKKCDHN